MERWKLIKCSTAVAAGASVIPVLPGTASAAARIFGANDKVVVGAIGINGMGMSDLRAFLQQEGVECAALCDVDSNVLEKRAAETTKGYRCGDHRYAGPLALPAHGRSL